MRGPAICEHRDAPIAAPVPTLRPAQRLGLALGVDGAVPSSACPPKVIVPRHSRDTFSPVRPSRFVSMRSPHARARGVPAWNSRSARLPR